MIFAPHILQIKVTTPMETDEFGRPIPGTGGESWQDVCKCRCDDNSTKEFTSENGEVYRPNYHIVCEKKTSLRLAMKSDVWMAIIPGELARFIR